MKKFGKRLSIILTPNKKEKAMDKTEMIKEANEHLEKEQSDRSKEHVLRIMGEISGHSKSLKDAKQRLKDFEPTPYVPITDLD